MPTTTRIVERDVEALVKLWAADRAPGGFRCTLREWAELALGYPNLSEDSKRLILHFQLCEASGEQAHE